MARQEVVSYIVTCDVCGADIAEGDARGASQKISWEGTEYVVDMCAADQAALGVVLGQLKTYVDAGSEEEKASARRRGGNGRSGSKAGRAASNGGRARKQRASAPPSGSGAGRSRMPAIRAWALETGHHVGHRGRIPARVVAAYDQAQAGATPAPGARKRRSGKAASGS